ncbi:MAG TPA: glycosyltransferase family 39 protein [Solirubrobacteraceae bacterium]
MASTAPVLLERPSAPELEHPAARVRPVAQPRDRMAWALGLVLAAGALLRVWQIDAVGLNSDEAVYVGQAAGIGHVQGLEPYFPIFRAHPLLFQTVLSFGFRLGFEPGSFERLAAVGVGILNVLLVFEIGRLLYGRRAGVLAAMALALMPYDVVVSRQVLLDGPMTLCATLALYMVVRFAMSERAIWLYGAGAALGLTVLAKETGIVLVGGIYAFFALSPAVNVRLKDLMRSMAVMGLVIAPYPLALMLSGQSGTGGNFLTWQLLRRPNHTWDFYATTVPAAIGPLVIVAAAVGLYRARRSLSWRETLLLSWILAPVAFFQVWPVKGYQYLLPAAPAVALLAGRGLAGLGSWVRPVAVAAVVLTLVVPTWQKIQPASGSSSLAGTGGVPGGREAGRWVNEHVPLGAQLLTVGPSMANILEFYGRRKAYGLSVSLNPLKRNPTYEPLANPDLAIRHGALRYVVWDAFSAERSPTFSRRLLRYADRYNGRVVETESVATRTRAGARTRTPVIVIYEVRP